MFKKQRQTMRLAMMVIMKVSGNLRSQHRIKNIKQAKKVILKIKFNLIT